VVLEQRTFVPVYIVHTAEKWAGVSKILFITAIESSKFLVTESYLEIAKRSSSYRNFFSVQIEFSLDLE